jgi:hypothetical protein
MVVLMQEVRQILRIVKSGGVAPRVSLSVLILTPLEKLKELILLIALQPQR